MAQPWRTVRVFISSTFKDMQAERDYLVRFVFPGLRERLLARRIHLIDVDLRWGVTGEQDALGVCREVIDECRPRFLCMLGERYGSVPDGQERSVTHDEVVYGALSRPEERAFHFFYFRDPDATLSVPGRFVSDYREPPDDPAHTRLAGLKEAIVRAGYRPYVYPGRWDRGRACFVGLEAFGARVEADLLGSIQAEFGSAAPEGVDEFAEEAAAMEAFVESRVRDYVVGSRAVVLRAMHDHVARTSGPRVMCVAGEPGSGKSALMGRFHQELAERGDASAVVLAHFVGASPASTNIRLTLRRLCHELSEAAASGVEDGCGAAPAAPELPREYERLEGLFADLLERVARDKRVVLIIDAVNQLDGAYDAPSARWLPGDLPEGVKVVLSTLAGPTLEALRGAAEPPRELVLAPLADEDIASIAEAFLTRYQKRLDRRQRAVLFGKADAGRPLYLVTALEELRTLGTYAEITRYVEEIPGETKALFDWMLKRLERDPGFRGEHDESVGALLVRRYCSLIAAARHGMSHAELCDIIDPGDPDSGGPADPDSGALADSRGNLSALYRLLRPYLMHRGELLDFFHQQLTEAVLDEYLDEAEERLEADRDLADYFAARADPFADRSWRGDGRALEELPRHLVRCGDLDRVFATLTDFGFLERKIAAAAAFDGATAEGAAGGAAEGAAETALGGVYSLIEDYQEALAAFPRDGVA